MPEILIVDDDSTVVLGLNKVLSDIGRIRFAADGQKALAMVAERLPDLIFLDIGLPDISGLEVCAKLKTDSDTSDIPVLFMTSTTGSDFEEKVFDVGAADYIGKPLNPQVVLARARIHLEYRAALQALESQARTDGLTGIANRRSFDERLSTELKRAKRYQLPLTLMMIDIDEFKKFNDHYGHLAGDECLKSVAQTMSMSARRPADFTARFGGEEFAVILPDTDTKGAATFAQILLNRMAEMKTPHAPEARRQHVSVSIGFTTLTPEYGDNDLVNESAIIETADQALYEAKSGGRDCFKYVEMRKRPLL
nr:diguanylate cyclase [Marinobacter sp. JH2]